MWKFTKDDNFSTNSAYLSIKVEMGVENTFKGAWVWKLDTIPKIMSYLWLCMHNSALVRDVLAGRGINCNPLCPICRQQGESIDHLLRECVFAHQFWLKIRSPNITSPLHNQS